MGSINGAGRNVRAGGRRAGCALLVALAAGLAVPAPAAAEDEIPEVILVGRIVVAEGTDLTADFPVLMTGLDPGESFTFKMETADASAKAGRDYAWTEQWFTFTHDRPLQIFSVPILPDTDPETIEQFEAWPRFNPWWDSRFYQPGQAQLVDADVVDSQSRTIVTIGDAVVEEPATGTAEAVFPIRAARVAPQDIVIDYRTEPGAYEDTFGVRARAVPAATPGADYTHVEGTTVIPAGQTEGEIRVPVHGDTTLDEPVEVFSLISDTRLARESNYSHTEDVLSWAYVTDQASVAAAPQPVVDLAGPPGTLTEGQSAAAVFTVGVDPPKSGPAHAPVRVELRVAGGSAAVGADFATPHPLVVEFGPTETEKTLALPLVDDDVHEPQEDIVLEVARVEGGRVGTGRAGAVIADNDPLPSLSIADATLAEGRAGALTIAASNPSSTPMTARVTSHGGSATPDADFVQVDHTVRLDPGQKSAMLPVTIIDDHDEEPSETFTIVLAEPTGAALGRHRATVTIEDDDHAGAPSGPGRPGHSPPIGNAPPAPRHGYWVVRPDGVHAFGAAVSVTPGRVPSPVAVSATPGGLWVLDRAGGVHAFGDAPFLGSIPGLRAQGVRVGDAPAVDLTGTPDGKGYWVLDASGGVHAFGDAPFLGSLPGSGIAGARAVAIAPSPSGLGYWLADVAGGVHAFGDAPFFGSIPGLRAHGVRVGDAPAVDLAAAQDGKGYWVLDAAGGVYAFGDAPFFGSIPGLRAHGVRVGDTARTSRIERTAAGDGYWLIDEHGGVFTFGAATFSGSVPSTATRR